MCPPLCDYYGGFSSWERRLSFLRSFLNDARRFSSPVFVFVGALFMFVCWSSVPVAAREARSPVCCSNEGLAHGEEERDAIRGSSAVGWLLGRLLPAAPASQSPRLTDRDSLTTSSPSRCFQGSIRTRSFPLFFAFFYSRGTRPPHEVARLWCEL